MIAGLINCKISLLEPQRVVDRMGAEEITYKLARTIWAERVSMQGRRSEEVGEHFSAYNAQYNVRSAHPVSENWRVQQLGGYLYNVVSVIPNGRKGYKTLVCERVNE